MGYFTVSSGSNIPLQLQLITDDATKFPQANVYDSTFTEIAGSPFNLAYFTNGLYINTTDASGLPDDTYTASYKIYQDSGHTTLVLNQIGGIDTFVVSPIQANVSSIKTDTDGLRLDYTSARALKLDHLDVDVSSRESDALALTRYNNIMDEIATQDSQITD